MPYEQETLSKGPHRNELNMANTDNNVDSWDPNWGPHKDFRGPFPCIVGWERKAQRPEDPRGLHEASDLALQRWQDDVWATGIRFYEDVNMAWKSDNSLQCRHVSPTECERLPVFPAGWTAVKESPETDETKYKRRNALGNAFAVPVISRLFIAMIMALKIPSSSAFPLWVNISKISPTYMMCWTTSFPGPRNCQILSKT